MQDPVTGFKYPEEWVARCGDADALEDIGRGLAVLMSDGSVKLRGFTTGTTAAAACMAAVLSFDGREIDTVAVKLACGLVFDVPVSGKDGRGTCRKFPGDYPGDATANVEFVARVVEFRKDVQFDSGEGIGRWDRETPRFLINSPAVSPTAMRCIIEAIGEACREAGRDGALLHLEVPEGRERAKSTLNERLGIIGGISVLGSTGLVEPWDDHLGQDAMDRVSSGSDVVITTGRVGLRFARLMFPGSDVVLVGANMAGAFASSKGPITLFGLPALIMKFIDPDVLVGSSYRTVEELVASDHGEQAIRRSLARFKDTFPGHRLVIIDREGRVLGDTS